MKKHPKPATAGEKQQPRTRKAGGNVAWVWPNVFILQERNLVGGFSAMILSNMNREQAEDYISTMGRPGISQRLSEVAPIATIHTPLPPARRKGSK